MSFKKLSYNLYHNPFLVVNNNPATNLRKYEKRYNDYLQIYLNPAQEELKITFSERLNTNTLITIIDTKGGIVWKNTISKDSEEYTVPVKTLKSGIYFVKIQLGVRSITQQFAKE